MSITGVSPGAQYKKFLKTKGAGKVDGDEVLGLSTDSIGHLDTIHETMKLRKKGGKGIEDKLVVHALGNGDYHFVDSSDNVYLWFHESKSVANKKMKFDDLLKSF